MAVLAGAAGYTQTHASIPLDDPVYAVLEYAAIKGWCAPLPAARPYSRFTALSSLREALAPENVPNQTGTERAALAEFVQQFETPEPASVPITANLGAGFDTELSGGFYPETGTSYWGTEIWANLWLLGDITRTFSYMLGAEGGLLRAPRKVLGAAPAYYAGFETADIHPADDYPEDVDGATANPSITAYSGPLTYLPYTYQKRWDGSVYLLDNLYGFHAWPDEIAGAYRLSGEAAASFWENRLFIRLGRIQHDWGGVPSGQSLALNRAARPFLGGEITAAPFSWLSLYTLSGVLEYENREGIKISAETFQNAYSISMITLRYKQIISADIGETVVWPKRYEIGYLVPFISSIFYQNNIGDFDNVAMFINLKAQYPGRGFIWASLFYDEVSWSPAMLELDRTMWAVQAGAQIALPVFSFSSFTFSYTKVNPYCYTHNRIKTPWYDRPDMETAYVNNGVSLGYYLPPNADEFLARFKTVPAPNILVSLQYQLIRHGADYGTGAVDGSSLFSELDPDGRDDKPVLRRYFLHDGAYQWTHIIRVTGEWSLKKAPLVFIAEAGTALSYFTNTAEPANGGTPHSYSVIDTEEYPASTGIMAKLKIKVFTR